MTSNPRWYEFQGQLVHEEQTRDVCLDLATVTAFRKHGSAEVLVVTTTDNLYLTCTYSTFKGIMEQFTGNTIIDKRFPESDWPTRIPHEDLPVKGWKYLVAHQHPWRRQLYLKDRGMTARQLVGCMKADNLSITDAADNWDLPIEAVEEALRYVEENAELLEMESAIERYIVAQGTKHA